MRKRIATFLVVLTSVAVLTPVGPAVAWCDCIKTPTGGGGTQIHLHYSTAINRAYADHWSGSNGSKSAVAYCNQPGTSNSNVQVDGTPDPSTSQSYRTCSGTYTQLTNNGYTFYP